MLTKRFIAAALTTAFALPASHAAVTTGALDSATGLQWAYASTVSEGQSLGYRAATAADFQTLLSDAGLTVNASLGSASATGEFGFGPSSDGLGNTTLGALSFPVGTLLGMTVQKTLPAPLPTASDLRVAFGWLGGQPGQLAAIAHYDDLRVLGCTAAVCATVMQSRPNDLAGWGSLDELMGGQHSTLVSPVDGSTPWSLGLQHAVGASWGYHMVKASAVPEASTGLTLAIGLLSLGWLARRTHGGH